MAHSSSNFGNGLQVMVGMGKEYGITSNSDMPQPFTPRKQSYGASGEQSLISQSRGRATNSLWRRDWAKISLSWIERKGDYSKRAK